MNVQSEKLGKAIVDRLLAEELIDPESAAELPSAIAGGKCDAERWRLLAELALDFPDGGTHE
jgi:hypothetical protein